MTTFTGHLGDAQAQRALEGVLEPSERHEVERHLAGCPACQALVESYRALSAALDGLDADALAPLPDDFTAGVLARIDARERSTARARWVAFAILGVVVAAAAALAAVAGASAWAPAVSGVADGLAWAARAIRVGSSFLPDVVTALRLQILLAAGLVALPILVAMARLIPAPRREIA